MWTPSSSRHPLGSISTTPTGSIESGIQRGSGLASTGSNSTTSAGPTPPDSSSKTSTSKQPKRASDTPTHDSPWPSTPKRPPKPTGQQTLLVSDSCPREAKHRPRAHLTRDGRAMESDQTPRAAPADGPDLVFLSRDGRIRTDDLSVPNAARYQAAPRPDLATNGRRPWGRRPFDPFQMGSSG